MTSGIPTHRVRKPFEGAGGQLYKSGDLVDATGWKWTSKLVEQGRLDPLDDAEPIGRTSPRRARASQA
jgi:hypothetical protein